jgi:hypothetical protein
MTQTQFQTEMGRLEVLGELLIENKWYIYNKIMNYIITEETLLLQKRAGIITESQYQ